MNRSFVAGLVLALVACDSEDDGSGGNGGNDGGAPTTGGEGVGAGEVGGAPNTSSSSVGGGTSTGGNGTGGNGTGGNGTGGSGTGGAGDWSESSHSCSATSRTDALWVDTDGTFWVGCGTTQVGYGLHVSTDGGSTFHQVTTSPVDEMAQFRVSSIQRGGANLLFVAGYDANDKDMVLRLNTSQGEPYAVTKILVGTNQTGRNFHVGSFALLGNGRIFAESLTGFGALYRPDAMVGSSAAEWDDAYYWAADGDGYQMMDLAVSNGLLYASGSTISEPPMLFMPPTDPNAPPYALVPVVLPNTGWKGEMWGIAADPTSGKVVVTGVDQNNDVGKIYLSGADPYSSADYNEIDIDTIVGDSGLGTWGRGACISGNRIAVVGERQPLGASTGLVMLSEDGGETFSNVTPPGVGESVTRCTFLSDGALVVTGASSFFGIRR